MSWKVAIAAVLIAAALTIGCLLLGSYLLAWYLAKDIGSLWNITRVF